MSDTYYQYKDAKVNIAHRLMQLDGWKVYGYGADNSDPYTDYYDPAYWGGIATKNGYTLVVDHSTAAQEYRRTYTVSTETNPEINEKIKKLQRMTKENGASDQEEATAKAAILKLQEKQTAGQKTVEEYTPGHLANPPRCNWHIEKNGVIIDKGTGLLKFAYVPDITRERYLKDWQDFNNLSREEWINKTTQQYIRYWNDTEERARASAESAYNDAIEKYKLLDKFNVLINRFNTIAGGMVGNAGENGFTYEIKKVIKYKTVYKFVPAAAGSFKAGQCFRLKHNFNYGCFAGLVYKFVASADGQTVHGQRVSLKSNKVLTGLANSSNSFGYYAADNATENHGRDKEKFINWINSGAIEWGEVVETKEPYEVEKAVKVDASGKEYKKPRTATKEAAAEAPTEEKTDITYIITPDQDTRDNSNIFVVKLSALASPEQFKEIRQNMQKIGGYYSRFKRGFIFKEDPTKLLYPDETEAAENTAPEAETSAAEEQPEQIPTDAPEEPKKAAYGYTGEASDFFTADEIEQLTAGALIKKGEGWRTHKYFAIDYINKIKFVYSVGLDNNTQEISPKANANYCGFIYLNKYFNDFEQIKKILVEDINSELIKQIPTETAAEENAVNLDKWQAEQVETFKNFDFTSDAQKHYIEDTAPELFIYHNYDRITTTDIINYIVDPAAVVAEIATACKQSHRDDILKDYIKYNKIVRALNEIRANKEDPAHVLKAIHAATSGGSEKTFKIHLANGHTVKAEANAVQRLPYCGYISSYYILSSDRQLLNQDERGRAQDIKPNEIISISHGAKVLYQKTA